MANPESDVEKLQLSLAGAALSLLACEEKLDPDTTALGGPYEIAKLLGYEGDFEPNDKVRNWLREFFNGPVAARVAKRMQTP
jgi:hypothetical protein